MGKLKICGEEYDSMTSAAYRLVTGEVRRLNHMIYEATIDILMSCIQERRGNSQPGREFW
jgi:hypothetical protein